MRGRRTFEPAANLPGAITEHCVRHTRGCGSLECAACTGNGLIRIQPEMRAPAMHHPWVGGVGHAVEAWILIGRGGAPFADSNDPLVIRRSHVLRVRALQDFGHRSRPNADTDIARHPGMDETDVR